jgi:hypothetical protein
MNGNVTALLKPEYIKQGYKLSKDEDFLYLGVPDEIVAVVFNAHTTTIEKVEEVIRHKEAQRV